MSKWYKNLWRNVKLPLLIVTGLAAFLYFLVPIAKWLIVDRTIAVYQEVSDQYSADDDIPPVYEGEIIDTIIEPSVKTKGAVDTTLHKQAIRITPQNRPADGKPKHEDIGVFGDSAGLLNAIFSFLAFVAVLVTIYLQSRKDSHDRRNGARMQFEQEFFAMVGMLEDIVSHLRFTDQENVELMTLIDGVAADMFKEYGNGGTDNLNSGVDNTYQPMAVEGRDVFRYMYKGRDNYSLVTYLNGENQNSSYSSDEAQRMCFDGTLDHYFRYLYRILKHIDESELLSALDDPETEREKYAHLLRAQLSNYELLMWFYNGLLGEHPKTVKPLIEKYAMFNNLRAWELGKKDSGYYQSILDGEVYEDPEGFNPNTTYSVMAFWSRKKLVEFKKNTDGEDGEGLFCKRIKEMLSGIGGKVRKSVQVFDAAQPTVVPLSSVATQKKTKEKQKEKKKKKAKGNKGGKKDNRQRNLGNKRKR